MIKTRYKWDLGESKKIRLEVFSNLKDDAFSIMSATYKLLRREIVVGEGKCEIEGTTISTHITPTEKAQYVLEITFLIADEIFIEKADIDLCWK